MSDALTGEGGAYVPCDELASPVPTLPDGVIRGQMAGFVARDELAAAVPTLPDGAIGGQGAGFVAKPCLTGCIDQTNLGRDLATSWIFTTNLTPNLDTYLNRTPTQRTIYGPMPLDIWLNGTRDNTTFYSYPHHLLPEPYPGNPICFIPPSGLHVLQCPPFVTWEHRIALTPTDIGGEHPWRTFIGDFISVGTTFDHDLQWEWQLMAGDWGTGTPTYGSGTVMLEGTTSYNDGRKEMPERLTGSSLDPYLQFYIKFKDPPPGSARVGIHITDDAAHENILRQCYLP